MPIHETVPSSNRQISSIVAKAPFSFSSNGVGNLALLKLAARLGLIAENEALAAHDAYRRLRQLQHACRLQGEKYARVEAAMLESEIAAVKKLWASVLGTTRAKS